MEDMMVCGCDVGSTTGKALLLRDGEIAGYSVIPCTNKPDRTARLALELARKDAGPAGADEISYMVGTGYGRVSLTCADENVSEISCHGRGAFFLEPACRTIIDIGGQDCKVIKLNERGRVVDFAMNDKCAAGTGRFYEAMARVLEVRLEDLAELSLQAADPASITSQCSVFAESEVISLVNEGTPLADIAAGINESIAGRLTALVRKAGLEPEVALTGGCAKNMGLIDALRRRLEARITLLPGDPQVVGALGAALIAFERAGAQR